MIHFSPVIPAAAQRRAGTQDCIRHGRQTFRQPGSRLSLRLSGMTGMVGAALLLMGAASSDPAERLADPRAEAHARTLFQQVRCMVCQNESIDDSEADLAADLRRTVRAQVAAGRTDDQVRRFLVDRYGEFVLLKPAFSPGNAVLWLTPFAIVLGGGAVFWLQRKRDAPDEAALTEDEQARIGALDPSG